MLKKKATGDTVGLLYPVRPYSVLLGFNLPFSLTVLNPEGNRGQTRKRIKFGIVRLIIIQ